jgi:hypothetical protein
MSMDDDDDFHEEAMDHGTTVTGICVDHEHSSMLPAVPRSFCARPVLEAAC